jgi:hypothetical protein
MDNDGDATEDVTYKWRFATRFATPTRSSLASTRRRGGRSTDGGLGPGPAHVDEEAMAVPMLVPDGEAPSPLAARTAAWNICLEQCSTTRTWRWRQADRAPRLAPADRSSTAGLSIVPASPPSTHPGLRRSRLMSVSSEGGQGELMVVAGGTLLSAASSGRRRQAARRGYRDRSLCAGGR